MPFCYMRIKLLNKLLPKKNWTTFVLTLLVCLSFFNFQQTQITLSLASTDTFPILYTYSTNNQSNEKSFLKNPRDFS